ncbi:hypothetical protein [Kitasatospora sp. NPDC054795]
MISQSDLVGAWTNGRGMTLRFDADHHLTSRTPTGSCDLDGTWQFYVRDSDTSSHSDRTATEGYDVSVQFPGTARQSSGCVINPGAFRQDGEYVLCLVDDPDTFCADDDLLHKTPEPGAQTASTPNTPAHAGP